MKYITHTRNQHEEKAVQDSIVLLIHKIDKIDPQHVYQNNYPVFEDRVVIDRVFETCLFTVISV